MGTWGYHSFENDAALDFCDEIHEYGSTSLLKWSQVRVPELGESEGEKLVAAAEIIASLRGHAQLAFENDCSDVVDWIARQPIDYDQIELAARDIVGLLNELADDSSLLEAWVQVHQDAQWRRSIEDLVERLERPRKIFRPGKSSKLRSHFKKICREIGGHAELREEGRAQVILSRVPSVENSKFLARYSKVNSFKLTLDATGPASMEDAQSVSILLSAWRQQLTHLNLDDTFDLPVLCKKAIVYLQSLRFLSLVNCKLDFELIQLFSELRSIRDMDLSGTNVNDDMLKTVAQSDSIKGLQVDRCKQITEQGRSAVLQRNPRLVLGPSNKEASDFDYLPKEKGVRTH